MQDDIVAALTQEVKEEVIENRKLWNAGKLTEAQLLTMSEPSSDGFVYDANSALIP